MPVELRMRNPIPGDSSHAIVDAYQFGVPDISEKVRLLLISKMISTPVYDELRTKKQLGYVVFGTVFVHASVLELRVVVQGNKELPDVVDRDIESVLARFGTNLRNMSADEFSRWRESIRSTILEKDKNMEQEADRFWSQIVSGTHCFGIRELSSEYLETLSTPSQVADLFDVLNGAGRRKVSVKLFGTGAELGTKSLGPGTAMVELESDSIEQKQRLKRWSTPYPANGICSIHRTAQSGPPPS